MGPSVMICSSNGEYSGDIISQISRPGPEIYPTEKGPCSSSSSSSSSSVQSICDCYASSAIIYTSACCTSTVTGGWKINAPQKWHEPVMMWHALQHMYGDTGYWYVDMVTGCGGVLDQVTHSDTRYWYVDMVTGIGGVSHQVTHEWQH